MDSLSCGALIASQFNRNEVSYGSPTHEDNMDEQRPKLRIRLPRHHKMKRHDDDDFSWELPHNSPGSGDMEDDFMNSPATMSMAPLSSRNSAVPVKRPRGRPRKLNPDGSFATNHIPLSYNMKMQQYNRRYATEHPRNLIPELCRQMFKMGWMVGTGGSMTIKQDKQIFITPSAVPKERLLPQDLFVLDEHGNLLDCPVQEKKLKMTDSAFVFLAIYTLKNAGAVIHTHSHNAVLATLLDKGQEFRISHQEMLKGMRKGVTGERYSNEETLIVPIIENMPSEKDLVERITSTMQKYPTTNAVLVRRHGLYVWGDTWQSAKSQAEVLDYLFELAVEMRRLGIDPAAEPSEEKRIAADPATEPSEEKGITE